ncbi:MAG: lysylphosphatidylglycerol synthase domain-containing protein [Planctomycetota bacterium]
MLKVGVVVVVLWAMGRHVAALTTEWSEQEKSLHDLSLNSGWIGVALVTFLGSQLCFSMFWARLLKGCGADVSPMKALRAYGVGTLGKYVPGKALVVLLRTRLLRDASISRLSVGLTVVYETLTMMAVGGAVASVCLLIAQPDEWPFWSGAAAGSCGLTACLHPVLFGRLAKLASLPFKGASDDFSAKACWAGFLRWGALPIGGWGLLGASFWGVAQAMGIPCSSADDFLFLTGTAAMATAVGFLVLFMPAGLGVRELVIIHLLAPRYGVSEVVLASLLLRTIWTLGEGLLGGALWSGPALLARLDRTATRGRKSASTVTRDADAQFHNVPDGHQDSVEDAARC